MSRRNSISRTEEAVEMIEQSEVKKRRIPPSIQTSPSGASPSIPNSPSSPVSPFVRHETILTIREEKTPVITAIKIDRSTYIRIIFVGAASAFMNSSAVGLGIYNLLTSNVDSGGYGIAIDPTTGGILAFLTTGILFTSVSYNLCNNDIKTLKNLKQDVQRIEIEKNSKKTSLDKQKIRFIKYALMFHQNNFTKDQKENGDFLEEKAEEFLLKNKISYKHNNLMRGIIELYDKIKTEHPEKNGCLTMEDFEHYLELHRSRILEDLFPLTQPARPVERPQSCRRSLCSTVTSYFFVPVNTIINLLGAVSLTAGQSAQASGSNLSPGTMISTTSVTSILGGVFIYWGTTRTQKEINQLEQQKQTDLQTIDDHKAQTAAFSQLASFAKGCSSELDQKALIQTTEEQKKQLGLVTKQLSEEKTDNLKLKTQLDEEKAENQRLRAKIQALQNPQPEAEYKLSPKFRRSHQPEITPLHVPREERFSPISGVSSPRSPVSFVGSCTVRKSPEPAPSEERGCIIS